MPRARDVATHLAEVPLFSRCSKRDLQTVVRHLEMVTVDAGKALVRQGQAGDTFYVLLDGKAVVRRNGRRIAELGPGDFFGELAVLDPAPRNADVVALTPVTVGVLPVRTFRRLLTELPAMNERLLAGLSRRLRDADRKSIE